MNHLNTATAKPSSSRTRRGSDPDDPHQASVLRQYCRAVVHMRNQLHTNSRFGLVFGAGASKDLNFPQWGELIKSIAAHPDVNASVADYNGEHSNISQRLFQRFRDRLIANLPPGYDAFNKLSSHIHGKWNDIIRKCLYENIPESDAKLISRDKYLRAFLPVIRETRLTVNYNFDDSLQRFLSHTRSPEDKEKKRGFRTVWTADVQLYAQNGVIYHPNGFLPSVRSERPSDQLIFLESSFGNQLIDSAAGHYSLLSYHYAQNTCLFIGLSLEDATLKHLLRKNALQHPGHVHYYVKFMRSKNALSEQQKKEIADANFEVYNLVTLFLTKPEIRALGKLLSYKPDSVEWKALMEAEGCPNYYYYLTGSVCVGKSTAVSCFRTLSTHDEWLDKKLEGMEKDPTKLSARERIQEIDDWVVRQWKQKNTVLRHADSGVHIIDRSPLDAFAFTPEDGWKEKASFTKIGVTGDSGKLTPGMVFLLLGHPNIMAVRALRMQKEMEAEDLDYRQALLRTVFNAKMRGVRVIDTCDKSSAQVAKEISRWIHLENYEPCDLSGRLEQVLEGKVSVDRAKLEKMFFLQGTFAHKYGRKKRTQKS